MLNIVISYPVLYFAQQLSLPMPGPMTLFLNAIVLHSPPSHLMSPGAVYFTIRQNYGACLLFSLPLLYLANCLNRLLFVSLL